MSRLRRLPFSRTLHRPNLLLGGERPWVIMLGVIAAGLILSDISVLKILVGVGVWTIGLALLRQMAKADPYLSQIYFRRLKYRRFYPAQSRAKLTP
jgi:type IV secretory pathway TrbD component